MAPGVRPACWAMRGIVAPSTPCCPSTSAVAFCNLRSDSRLRSCCGARVFFAMGNIYTNGKILLDKYVNVNLHLHIAGGYTKVANHEQQGKREDRKQSFMAMAGLIGAFGAGA